MSQQVKNLPAKKETMETRVQSLGHKETLEEEMATHSSILAWKHGQSSLVGYSLKESQRVGYADTTEDSAYPIVTV